MDNKIRKKGKRKIINKLYQNGNKNNNRKSAIDIYDTQHLLRICRFFPGLCGFAILQGVPFTWEKIF